MRWETEHEYMRWEIGDWAAWLLVLEHVAFGQDEKVALYLGSYASTLALEHRMSKEMVR